ncbi:glycerophosphodiester phosphodiesterase family protein [Leucobacter massiliensis]|uniref:glycerophosphodiester phosphodiesterase n=1 Tax=Leucobacter massiliensis TaxID=1686285 RepID=A0A2S9QPJ1_9MICO|nr:glycerophosphodiester phosphodiesterase family protein [Leucobacter massiliensis]PRI11504.1 glycerophosphodiester phosphodiesterase [Leucobacter massiliensis]
MRDHPVPRVIAHRGASGHRPEHTASAYRLALELGADAVEPDVVATRDGVLVVRHENEISGTTDVAGRPEFADRRRTKVIDGVRLSGWFTEDFSWEELATLRCRERLPGVRPGNAAHDRCEGVLRLRDVLAIVDAGPGEAGVVVEVKHAAYFLGLGLDLGELLLAELAACGWAERPDRLVIESFELGVLDRLRRSGVRATLVFLAERTGAPADEPLPGAPARSFGWYRGDAGLALLADRVDGISVAKGDLLRLDAEGRVLGPTDLVERAHGRGLLVYTWTLRPENRFLAPGFRSSERKGEWGDWAGEFGTIVGAGVDGIFVDHPELGVAARSARGVSNTPEE